MRVVLLMQKGIFLCKLKNKEDEKADTSSSESCLPSQVADDGIPESAIVFDLDELLATLGEQDGRDEAENNFFPAIQLPMDAERVPHFYDLSGEHDGVQYISNSNEENDDFWIRYLVDNVEYFLNERSNEQVENVGCNLSSFDMSVTALESPLEKDYALKMVYHAEPMKMKNVKQRLSR